MQSKSISMYLLVREAQSFMMDLPTLKHKNLTNIKSASLQCVKCGQPLITLLQPSNCTLLISVWAVFSLPLTGWLLCAAGEAQGLWLRQDGPAALSLSLLSCGRKEQDRRDVWCKCKNHRGGEARHWYSAWGPAESRSVHLDVDLMTQQ